MIYTCRNRAFSFSFLVSLVLLAAATWLPTEGRVLQKRAAFYIANETMCIVDGEVYRNGDPVPTDDQCERCTCRPPGFSCVLRDCDTKPGCKALRREGECCPEYVCGCVHNHRVYEDGEVIRDLQNACYTCRCHGSSISCTFADCLFRSDCVPEYVAGECCPRYDHCPPLSTASSTTLFTTLRPIIQQEEVEFVNMTTLHLEKFTSEGTTLTIKKISPSTMITTTPSGEFETESVRFTVDFTLSEGKGSSILDYDTSVLTTLIPPQSVSFTETTKHFDKLSTLVETSSKSSDAIDVDLKNLASTQATFTDTEFPSTATEHTIKETEFTTDDKDVYSVASSDSTVADSQKSSETPTSTEASSFETETFESTNTEKLSSVTEDSKYSVSETEKSESHTSEPTTAVYPKTIVEDGKESNSSVVGKETFETTHDTVYEASIFTTTDSTDLPNTTSPVSWIEITTETITKNSTIVDFDYVSKNESVTIHEFTTQASEPLTDEKENASSVSEMQFEISPEATTLILKQTESSFIEHFNSTESSVIETEEIRDSDVTESAIYDKGGLTHNINDSVYSNSTENGDELFSESEFSFVSNSTANTPENIDSDISTHTSTLSTETSTKPYEGDEVKITTSITTEEIKISASDIPANELEINLLETRNDTLEVSQTNDTLKSSSVDDNERYSNENTSTSDAQVNYSGEGSEFDTADNLDMEGTKISVDTSSTAPEEMIIKTDSTESAVSRFSEALTTLIAFTTKYISSTTEATEDSQDAESYHTEDTESVNYVNSNISYEETRTSPHSHEESTSITSYKLEINEHESLTNASEIMNWETFNSTLLENLTSIQESTPTAFSTEYLASEISFNDTNAVFNLEESDTLENKVNDSVVTDQENNITDTSTAKIFTLQPLQFSTEIIDKHFLQYQTTQADIQNVALTLSSHDSSITTEGTHSNDDDFTTELNKGITENLITSVTTVESENYSTNEEKLHESNKIYSFQNSYESSNNNFSGIPQNKAPEPTHHTTEGIILPSTAITAENNFLPSFDDAKNQIKNSIHNITGSQDSESENNEDFNVLHAEESFLGRNNVSEGIILTSTAITAENNFLPSFNDAINQIKNSTHNITGSQDSVSENNEDFNALDAEESFLSSDKQPEIIMSVSVTEINDDLDFGDNELDSKEQINNVQVDMNEFSGATQGNTSDTLSIVTQDVETPNDTNATKSNTDLLNTFSDEDPDEYSSSVSVITTSVSSITSEDIHFINKDDYDTKSSLPNFEQIETNLPQIETNLHTESSNLSKHPELNSDFNNEKLFSNLNKPENVFKNEANATKTEEDILILEGEEDLVNKNEEKYSISVQHEDEITSFPPRTENSEHFVDGNEEFKSTTTIEPDEKEQSTNTQNSLNNTSVFKISQGTSDETNTLSVHSFNTAAETLPEETTEEIHSVSLKNDSLKPETENEESTEPQKTNSSNNLDENTGTELEAGVIDTDSPEKLSYSTLTTVYGASDTTLSRIMNSTNSEITKGLEKHSVNLFLEVSKPMEETFSEGNAIKIVDNFKITDTTTESFTIKNENSSTYIGIETFPTIETSKESNMSHDTLENSKNIGNYEAFGYLGGVPLTGKSKYLPKNSNNSTLELSSTEISVISTSQPNENDTIIYSGDIIEMDSEIQSEKSIDLFAELSNKSETVDIHKDILSYDDTLHTSSPINSTDNSILYTATAEVSQTYDKITSTDSQKIVTNDSDLLLSESSEIHNATDIEENQKIINGDLVTVQESTEKENASLLSTVTAHFESDGGIKEAENLTSDNHDFDFDSISSSNKKAEAAQRSLNAPYLNARSNGDDDPLADIEYLDKPLKPIIYSTSLSTQFQVNSKKNVASSNRNSSSMQVTNSDLIPGVDIILPSDSVTFPSENSKKDALEKFSPENKQIPYTRGSPGEAYLRRIPGEGNIHSYPYFDLVSNVFKAPGYDSELHSQYLRGRHGYSTNKAYISRVKREGKYKKETEILIDSSPVKNRPQFPLKIQNQGTKSPGSETLSHVTSAMIIVKHPDENEMQQWPKEPQRSLQIKKISIPGAFIYKDSSTLKKNYETR